MATPLTETQWRQHFDAATEVYAQLKALALLPLDEEANAGPALQHWTQLMVSLDVNRLEGDPAFAAPLLEQLQVMNEELRQHFTDRRDALGQAFKQQKKNHAGIDAYRGS
ncbi:hypothetical protein [Marinobacterium marinum]|uniref:Flagellar protein FliT n=1 Tax=Marinobacterium marinum TaxID=2756129 RepID=A0A7W1WVC6_9GAMM|nr:hypothetical protein [Marinobacterium marinum]MBA4500913.1 hypothetical protein [Marinobacterium marinum]